MSNVTTIHRVSVTDRAQFDPMCGFHDQHDFLGSVMTAAHGRVDSRLLPLRAEASTDEHGTHSDPHGGFWFRRAWRRQRSVWRRKIERGTDDADPDGRVGRRCSREE